MALATHNRPTYTERNRAWGVGMADPADLEPSHLTWRLRQKRRQPSAVSDVSATLALRYMDGRRWDRRAAWRLSIGSGVAKCKSAALFLAHAHRPSRPGPRARRAIGRRPGASHPHRLGDSQLAAVEAAGARALAVWHNHPWTGPDSSFGVKTPEDLCSLSQPDLRTVVADSIPFAVVSVGRTSRPIVCWWRRVQAVVNRHVKFLPRFPRQWIELSSFASLTDPSLQPATGP